MDPTFGSIGAPSPPNSAGCAAGTFIAGTSVSVTATPTASYYVLARWGGVASGTNLTTTFTMPAVNATVQAFFTQRNYVYGQVDFTHSAAGGGPTGLNTPVGVAISPADELYVADTNNHRVTVYLFVSLTPSRVIGPAGFSGAAFNRGKSVPAANTVVVFFPKGQATRVFG